MEKLDFIDSKFRLALLAAKRAKQLVGGSKKKIDSSAENLLTTAIEEIYSGKIKYKILSEDEMERLHSAYYTVPPIEAVEEPEELLFGPRDLDDLELDTHDEDEDEDDDID